jgi:hypothetical protein
VRVLSRNALRFTLGPMKGDLRGESVRLDEPVWQPLLNLVAGPFMWMFAVDLEDGRRVHAYKHYYTRRYIHLSEEGDEAFVYTAAGRYRQVDPEWLLDLVLEGASELRG